LFATRQSQGLVLSAVAAFVCLSALQLTGVVDLGRYLGPTAPIASVAFVLISGVLCLWYLQRTERLKIFSSPIRRAGLRMAALMVVPFAIGITVIDLAHPFPEDINVALPAALAFYPAIGLIAILALHVMPFAFLLGIGRLVAGGRVAEWWVWVSILTTASIEAVFQAVGSAGSPAVVVAYVAVSLYLFGVVELVLYRRFDYLTMFTFRMLYYAYWHVGWGALRLGVIDW
jgi:uncharacterized protein YhhL (DUF1145 family)